MTISPARRVRIRLGTVRVRITMMATAVVALALVIGSVVLVSLLDSRLTDTVRITAQTHADQVADAISTSGLAALTLSEDDDRLVQVVGMDGEVIRSSSDDLGAPLLSDVAAGESEVIHLAADDDDYLAVAATAQTPQGAQTVVVAHSLDLVAESRGNLTALLAIGLPILLVLLAATTWRVVGGSLAPVEQMRAEVDEVSAHELHRRVRQPTGDDEISRLAETMNRMLARLEAARADQQRFVSDASHELRSPMASIRTHAEVALTHPEPGQVSDLAKVVLAEALRLQQLVDSMLVLARADERTSATVSLAVDLDDLVFEAAHRLRATDSVVLDTSGVSAARVRGDATLLRRVVSNLLDNAVRHARSTVKVMLQESRDSVLLRVEDDGAGVAAQDRDRIFARFARLDDARNRDDGGAGLGLAIVARVVAGHGGTVTLTESPGGGAAFEVRLPSASQ